MGQPFKNSILGGQGTLIREMIMSPNYVPGVSGWIIRKDGSAEFNDVVVRGTIEGTDLFAYDPSPGLGDLRIAINRNPRPQVLTDPYGNKYYGTMSILSPPLAPGQMTPAKIVFGINNPDGSLTIKGGIGIDDAGNNDMQLFSSGVFPAGGLSILGNYVVLVGTGSNVSIGGASTGYYYTEIGVMQTNQNIPNTGATTILTSWTHDSYPDPGSTPLSAFGNPAGWTSPSDGWYEFSLMVASGSFASGNTRVSIAPPSAFPNQPVPLGQMVGNPYGAMQCSGVLWCPVGSLVQFRYNQTASGTITVTAAQTRVAVRRLW